MEEELLTLTEEEETLLTLLRELDNGELSVTVENGVPVRVTELRVRVTELRQSVLLDSAR